MNISDLMKKEKVMFNTEMIEYWEEMLYLEEDDSLTDEQRRDRILGSMTNNKVVETILSKVVKK